MQRVLPSFLSPSLSSHGYCVDVARSASLLSVLFSKRSLGLDWDHSMVAGLGLSEDGRAGVELSTLGDACCSRCSVFDRSLRGEVIWDRLSSLACSGKCITASEHVHLDSQIVGMRAMEDHSMLSSTGESAQLRDMEVCCDDLVLDLCSMLLDLCSMLLDTLYCLSQDLHCCACCACC